jgi:nicotinamidase/pyrazinamidase
MPWPYSNRNMSTVFFDIDTQIDFLYPAGALYVGGAERLLPALETLNQYAAAHGIAVISTVDAHAEGDPEFQHWPPHCVAGTAGQRKPAATVIAGARQVIFEKRELDAFSNPELPGLIEQLGADRCVVYGVTTEYCVRYAVLGLLKLGKAVEVVADAIGSLDEAGTRRSLDEFQAAGARLTTLAEVTSS